MDDFWIGVSILIIVILIVAVISLGCLLGVLGIVEAIKKKIDKNNNE